jgi:protein ImuB
MLERLPDGEDGPSRESRDRRGRESRDRRAIGERVGRVGRIRLDRRDVSVLTTWGLNTLGELAAIPRADLSARLGPQGLVWQAIARGEDVRPLVPALEAERFESSQELEWPIEDLEPLSFVLTRLLEPLSTRLERRDRGAAVLHVVLRLVTRDTVMRSLRLPSPMRDMRTLRTLALLDLESHPPAAAIDRVQIVIDPTPGRVLQHTLFSRPHPTAEQISTLLARLGALMGQDRIGAPAVVDTYRPGAFAMTRFKTDHESPIGACGAVDLSPDSASRLMSALRRCRQPVPARVTVAGGRPARVTTDRRGFDGGLVLQCAGPWRTSGEWWSIAPMLSGGSHQAPWNRDEWDVALGDGAIYRIFRDRDTDRWFIDAIVD